MNNEMITAAVSLLAAVLSFVASYSSKKSAEKCNEATNRINKEISITEQESENKRNELQIDANIVWTARVEWIQNVRNLTAEFISSVNNYIISDNNELRKKKFEIMWEKSRLLILYFGPDGVMDDEISIKDKNSNKAKNEKIVQLIEEICAGAETYFLNIQSINEYEGKIDKCEKCKNSDQIYETCGIFESGKLSIEDQNAKCEDYKMSNLENIIRCNNQNNEFKAKINTLIETMRIYLKIEWNRTKERKG
mgnify:CR=1 FL=1